MPTLEITTNLKQEIAVNIQAIITNTSTVGNIIAAADFDHGINFSFFSGARTDGTYNILIEHGDASDLSDAVAVPDSQLRGQDPTSTVAPELQAQITAANKIKKIGYVGPKAFVRATIVSTVVTTGATLGCIVSKMPEIMPAAITV